MGGPRSPPPSWRWRGAFGLLSRKPSSCPSGPVFAPRRRTRPKRSSPRLPHYMQRLHRTSTELRATKNCKRPRKPRRSGGVSAEPHPLMPKYNGNKWGQRQDFPIICRDPARRLLPLPRSTADGSTSSIATQRLAPRAKEDRQLLPAPPNELSQSAIKKSKLVSEINSQKTRPLKDDSP